MILGAVADGYVIGGGAAFVLGLAGYLFKELRRKDDGVWAIIADKDRQIAALEKDRNYWRDRTLSREDERIAEAEAEAHRRRREELAE